MSLFIDRHEITESLSPEEVAALHVCDLEIEAQYDVKFLTYWYFSGGTAAFCLVEAPNKEMVEIVHRDSHGYTPVDVIEVDWRTVEGFLGPIHEPEPMEPWEDSPFRTVLCTEIEDERGLTRRLGGEAFDMFRRVDRMASDTVKERGGREILVGSRVVACFPSTVAALESALAMQQLFGPISLLFENTAARMHAGISAGEPVFARLGCFEAAVNEAAETCSQAKPGQILVTQVVRDICAGNGFGFDEVSQTSKGSLFSLLGRVGGSPTWGVPVTGGQARVLSTRELEVLKLITLGKTNQEIADLLFISHNTVTTHVRNIFSKTEAANRAEAASYAIRHRLV